MYIKEFEGKAPRAVGRCYVAENATLIGDVTLEKDVSVWPGAVLRGDYASITIGAGSNLQDGVIVHGDTGIPTVVGENCLIGHAAILHSCVLEPGALVGMGAVVMTGAHIGAGAVILPGVTIGDNTVIGAGSIVTHDIPADCVAVGNPCRVVRGIGERDFKYYYKDREIDVE